MENLGLIKVEDISQSCETSDEVFSDLGRYEYYDINTERLVKTEDLSGIFGSNNDGY